jgi:exonuclease III
MVYKTKKLRKQRGRGILRDGIKSKVTYEIAPEEYREFSYKKICPEGFVMCDQDEVNSTLCVPTRREDLCSNPNYKFRYIPPDDNDRDGINPLNRLIQERDGKGPIQDPDNPVDVFKIQYDDDENFRSMFEDDVIENEEKGRLKSYAPEYNPTSCAVQQKTEATIEKIYEEGQLYKKRNDGIEIPLSFSTEFPRQFTILTQNALGLYRGRYREPPEPGKALEATYDIMKLRTALFRQFLKNRSPDFVCLQESTRTFIDLLDKDEVNTMYPYMYPTEEEMVELVKNGSNATTSMLSKYPAKKATTYMLQGNSSYYNALGVYEFDNLIIFNVYMQAGSEISPGLKYRWDNFARCRRQQLIFVKQKIEEVKAACECKKGVIVLGDFNFELNSIHYRGEGGEVEKDSNNHLIYDPTTSDMKWSEHKFLVGPNGLNLNDSYKELHINNPDNDIKRGLTEYTDINTLRYLGKLEKKELRYDGIFFNNDLNPISSEVVNNIPVKLNMDAIGLFEANGVPEYIDNIKKYNEEYEKFMVFKPNSEEATKKKERFFSVERPDINKENGFEVFVSDHFGVMTTFEFKETQTAGRRKKRVTRRKNKSRKRKTRRR